MWWHILLESSFFFFYEAVQLQSLGLNYWFTCFSTCAAIHSGIYIMHSWNSLPVGKHRKDLSNSFPDKGNIQLFLSWSVQFCSWANRFRENGQLWCYTNKTWPPARNDSCMLFHLYGDTVSNTSDLTLLLVNSRHQSLNCNSGTLLICQGRFHIKMDLSHIIDTTCVIFPVDTSPCIAPPKLSQTPRLFCRLSFVRKSGIWDKSHTVQVSSNHLAKMLSLLSGQSTVGNDSPS